MVGNRTAEEVGEILRARLGSSPMPYLRDPQVRARARDVADKLQLIESLRAELTPDQPIPVLGYTRFRDYRRDGNRTRYQNVMFRRARQIDQAAMAVYLGLDYVDYLQDLLWAQCETTTWIMPAHERRNEPVDLAVAGYGERYAVIVTALAEELCEEVRERVAAEVRRRVIDPFLDPACPHRWKQSTNNWNAVCHASTCIAAMLLEPDADRLTALVRESLANLDAYVAGLSEDGGCSEGPGYWRYGFGHYAHLAAALWDYSGGQIDLMQREKIRLACEYPFAVAIAPGQELEFADAHSAYLSISTAVEINRFHPAEDLFGLCRLHACGLPEVQTFGDLLLHDGQPRRPWQARQDSYLPELAVARLRSGSVTVGAKAGHNAEHHNHNDVGSFVVHAGGTFFLCDPGAPEYSRDTFSDRRYDSIFCNSRGHSVPVVDGSLQPAGAEFAGAIQVEGLDTDGAKVVRIEMAGAYDVPSLQRLTRTISLSPGGSKFTLTDEGVFSQAPRMFEEAFMTFLPAEVLDDGAYVRLISDADGSPVLRAEGAAGRFAVEELAEESSRECRTGGLLRRITFTPAELADEMTLRFVLAWE